MKEDYFGEGKLLTQAGEFLAAVSRPSSRRKQRLDLSTAALLVTDVQDYFLEERSHAHIPSANAVVPQIKKLQALFLSKQRPVFQTRHINNSGDAGQMAHWWKELITVENPLSAVTKELIHPDVPVILKSQYDAFFNTPLEKELRSRGVTRVVVTGVMTHLCCETTARSAFIRGFGVFFVVDATATYNRRFHEAALLNLSHGFAVPVLTQEILDEKD